MNKIEKIKAEIERRKKTWNHQDPQYVAGGKDVCDYLLGFIDSLEEEPVSNDLEKAAIEAFKQIVDSDKNSFLEIFKAGAQWRKQQIIDKAFKYINYQLNLPSDFEQHFRKAVGE